MSDAGSHGCGGENVREMQVDRVLRERRNELELSQLGVAELTELSIGFLSQLENDQVAPSPRLAESNRPRPANPYVRTAQF